MEQLVGLMNKAHGHADGEVIQMDGSHSGLHTNLLNQYAHLRRKRFSEEELRKFVDIENLVNEYATLDRQKEFKQLDLNSGESTGSNGAKTKLSGDTINVGEYLKQTKPTVAKVYLDLSKFRKEFPPSIGSEATQFKINGNYKQSEGPYDTNLVQKNKTIGGKAKADQGKENELSKFQIMKNFDKKIKRDNPLQGSPKNPLGMKAQTATNPDEVKREAAEQRLHKRQKYGNEANEKNTRRFTKESQGFAGNKLEEVPRKLEVTPVSQQHLLPGGLGKMTKSVIFEDTEEDLNEKKGATLTLKKNTKNGKKYTPVRSTNAQGEKPEDLPKTSAFHKGMQYDNERRRKEEAESLRKSDKNSLD
jgi:hypothetical protein